VLTLGQPIGAIAAANPMISQHPWVPAAKTTASVYNDDLQGTGGIRLAGLINTLKITGGQLKEQRVLFVGAEPAAIGLADLTVAGMGEQSVTPEAARQQIRMFDTQGLGSRGVPALPRTSCPTRASYPQQTLRSSRPGDRVPADRRGHRRFQADRPDRH
jgi:malic enzyme